MVLFNLDAVVHNFLINTQSEIYQLDEEVLVKTTILKNFVVFEPKSLAGVKVDSPVKTIILSDDAYATLKDSCLKIKIFCKEKRS